MDIYVLPKKKKMFKNNNKNKWKEEINDNSTIGA